MGKNFRKEFWKQKNTVGAMAPSTKYLRSKMLKNIDFQSDKIFVELGPGTGVFTHEIIKLMAADAKLLVFEINDSFYEQLSQQISDDRVYLIHESAEKIQEYLEKYGLDKADVVLSSLPLAVFSEQLRTSILDASHVALKSKGKYIQFQYSLQSKKLLKEIYNTVRISFTAFNFPPAFVYTCIKQ